MLSLQHGTHKGLCIVLWRHFFLSSLQQSDMAMCHQSFVMIFRRNRIREGSGGMAAVNNIYIIMQKVCFWKITRPLFSRKQAGFIAQTALFFHWKTGVFVPNRTKIFAQNGIGACNILLSKLLRLHTILSHFCGQMVFIFKYRSMRASTKINV